MIDTTFLAVSSLMLLAGYAVMGRGNLIRLRQQARKAWDLLERPVRQRGAALTELAPLCRHWLPQEGGAQERILAAHAQVASAHQGFDAAAFGRSEALLREQLGRLFTAAETLSDQGARAQFRGLAERIVTFEAKLSEYGRVYNSAVDFHNMQIKQFPYLLLAHVMGYRAFERLDPAIWKTAAPAAM